MRYLALAGALAVATMAAGASAQSPRDRAYDYYGRSYDAPPYGYRRQVPPGNAYGYDEQEAYERGRDDELYRQRRLEQQRQLEQQRRDPTIGEQLGDFLDQQMQQRQPR